MKNTPKPRRNKKLLPEQLELDKTKHLLVIKEAELQAVIAQAEEMAHTDELTFLPNRRQIMGDLQREVIFSDRYSTPLSIAMLDLDHFKQINAAFGYHLNK
jgi:GGDEF domain-containing protein